MVAEGAALHHDTLFHLGIELPDRVAVIAPGHSIGATGAILTTRLIHSMRRDGLRRGVVTLASAVGRASLWRWKSQAEAAPVAGVRPRSVRGAAPQAAQ